jgi:hypothetical protein
MAESCLADAKFFVDSLFLFIWRKSALDLDHLGCGIKHVANFQPDAIVCLGYEPPSWWISAMFWPVVKQIVACPVSKAL